MLIEQDRPPETNSWGGFLLNSARNLIDSATAVTQGFANKIAEYSPQHDDHWDDEARLLWMEYLHENENPEENRGDGGDDPQLHCFEEPHDTIAT